MRWRLRVHYISKGSASTSCCGANALGINVKESSSALGKEPFVHVGEEKVRLRGGQVDGNLADGMGTVDEREDLFFLEQLDNAFPFTTGLLSCFRRSRTRQAYHGTMAPGALERASSNMSLTTLPSPFNF